MKRVVTFKTGDEAKNQQRFELLYSAILAGGSTPSRGSGIDMLRKEARLLDALDAISDEDGAKTTRPLPTGDHARLVRTDAELVLSQPEHELLKKRLEDGPWSPGAARAVVDCADWLGSAADRQD